MECLKDMESNTSRAGRDSREISKTINSTAKEPCTKAQTTSSKASGMKTSSQMCKTTNDFIKI